MRKNYYPGMEKNPILKKIETIINGISTKWNSFYFYITDTIRAKLIMIISTVVLVSISFLIYIALTIFEENMTNMIVFLHAKANNIMADKVNLEVKAYINKTKKLAKGPGQGALKGSEYSDILYVSWLFVEPGGFIKVNKQVFNSKLLAKMKLPKPDFQKKVRAYRLNISKTEFLIQNLAPVFEQPLWLISIPEGRNIFVSIIRTDKFYRIFIGEDDSTSEAIYTSYMIEANGNLILHPEKERLQTGENLLSHPIVTKMFEGKSSNGVLRFEDRSGTYFGSFNRLDSINAGVISSIPEKLALEGVDAVRWGAILISIIIVSTAVLFIYFFSDTLSKPLRTLVDAADKVKNGEYRQRISIKTHDEVGKLTNAFNLMTQGLQEREKLKGALGKFVNEEITNQVLKGEIKLGGERKEATVLFIDIRSFTAISEKLQPEKVVEFLNEYMTLMVSIIYHTGGVVDKFIGDAIMAIWGAPIPKGNDVENSLNAALKMRDSLITFNEARKKNRKFPVFIGCGLNTGPIISGQIGSPERLEYTVIGDTVNLASRIEALSKPFAVDIVITENTYKKIKDIFNVVPMQKVKVAGKVKVQQIYALLGRKDDPEAPKNLKELRKKVGITRKPNMAIMGTMAEKKYEIV